MIALFSLPLFLNLIANAATPVDPAQLAAKLGAIGLKFSAQNCEARNLNEGRGGQLAFTEVTLGCGHLTIQIEATHPVQSALVKGQINTEVARIQEVYGASKNPYAGYVSQTAQCPQKDNLWQGKNAGQPFLIGRVTERGAWGACGKSTTDNWAALTFIESRQALTKIRIQSQKPTERTKFSTDAKEFLLQLKAGQ